MSQLLRGKIRDFVEGLYDGPHATPPEADDGPIFLGIKNVTPSGRLDLSEIRHVSEQDFPRWTRRVIPQEGDIVFSYEATLHRYARIPAGFRGCLGRRMALVRPKPELVDPRYLHMYFLSRQWRTQVEAYIISGATVDRIPLSKFPDFELVLPPLEEQRRIADIVDAYDQLIENNRRRIQLLEESARLLYREWFVHLRFPGHEHVKVVDGVPEGWERKPLGELTELRYGKALKQENRVGGPYPVYGSSGEVGTHEKCLVAGPGIVVGRKGNVGSVYWVYDDFWPIDTVYYVEPERVSFALYYALAHTTFVSSDAAVPGLNRKFAYSRPVLWPEERLRSEFEDFVSDVSRQISNLIKQNRKLAEARDLLLPRLMNGEIAV